MIYMLTMNLTMSLIFITMNHPLSTGMMLLLQTLLIALMAGTLNFTFWYSYILFLIMAGAMLILFIYMTSIASNEKFKMNIKVIIILPLSVLMVRLMKLCPEMSMMNKSTMPMELNCQINLSMNKFMNFTLNITLVMMMIYLLLTLVAAVKIFNMKQGPLRQMFN